MGRAQKRRDLFDARQFTFANRTYFEIDALLVLLLLFLLSFDWT